MAVVLALGIVLALLAYPAKTAVADEDNGGGAELFGSPHLRDFDDARMSWIRRCSQAAVAEFAVGWALDSGAESEEVFHCLLANADLVGPQRASDAETSARYHPPFVNGWSLRGDPARLPEALIRTATKVLIVAGGEGIEGLLHLADDRFLVSVGYATYIGIYLLSVESHRVVYLTDGFAVAIEDPAVPTFRVSGSSSYFKGAAASGSTPSSPTRARSLICSPPKAAA